MKLDEDVLNVMFKEYYNTHRVVATHVFVYSKSQVRRSLNSSFCFFRQNYVNGEKYSEMRSRDVELEFNDKDTVIVGVGSYKDVNNHK